MNKVLSGYFLISLTWSSLSVMAQVNQDSVAPNRINVADSIVVSNPDSGNNGEASNDNIYQPVADSLFSPSVPIRKVPEIQVNRYKSSPDYAYANDPQYWQQEAPQEPGFLLKLLLSPVLWKTFLAILTGLILYGVYQLAKENNFKLLLRTSNSDMGGRAEWPTDERIDFDEAIRRNQAEGNYRMAIRFLYLRLIQILGEKEGIAFRQSSTNTEITQAMGTHPQANQFRWLAKAYEHIFYGSFLLNQETYDSLKMEFDRLQKNLAD